MDALTEKHLRAWCLKFGWDGEGETRFMMISSFLDGLDVEDRIVWLDRGWSALWDHLMERNFDLSK